MSSQTLSLRSGRDPGHVIKHKAITDTTPVSLIVEMSQADLFSLELAWTGTLAADLNVYMSNSYNPNPTDPQNEAIALRAGNWISTGSRYLTDWASPNGSPGASEIHGANVECCYLKFVILPTDGAGTLDGYLSGKSIG